MGRSVRRRARALAQVNRIAEEEGVMGRRMPGRNFLFVPGPTNVPDRVQRAVMVAMEDHRSSRFPELLSRVLKDLKKLFKTDAGQGLILRYSVSRTCESVL